MTENQPRDDDGRFTEFDKHNPKDMSNDGTLGIYDESQITPRVEFTNVDIDKLQHAIDVAKEYDNVVRIGTINNTGQEDGEEYEKGLVLLKSLPSDDEVVVLAGLYRSWAPEGEE